MDKPICGDCRKPMKKRSYEYKPGHYWECVKDGVVYGSTPADSPSDTSGAMPTNEYGQTVDGKGHVLTASELIEQELRNLDRAMVATESNAYPTVIQVPLEDLTAYILQRVDDDHWPTLKQGIAIGRKEGLDISLAAIDSIEQSLKSHTVPEGVGLLSKSYVANTLRFERERLAQAARALEKGEKK